MVADQLNIEYWFRILYDCLFKLCTGSAGSIDFSAWLTQVWSWIVIAGYLIAAIALAAIVYVMIRLFDLRARESAYYGTLLVAPESAGGNPRWTHIESLAESGNASDWRTAIIEADILLDDMLTKQGYAGESVGEKLRSVEPSDFSTVRDAWEAHKVRNQIAHDGSSFDLSDTLARRTLARYEAVFREFKML